MGNQANQRHELSYPVSGLQLSLRLSPMGAHIMGAGIMSLLNQLKAFIEEGKIAKAGKPQKKGKKKPDNPNIAKKYTRPGHRLPGERHGYAPPVPKPVIFNENRAIVEGKFAPIRPVTFTEQYGYKSAVILTDDDVSALRDLCKLMDEEEAKMVKYILREALHVDGNDLAILKVSKNEV
jgi:hypothetical protein